MRAEVIGRGLLDYIAEADSVFGGWRDWPDGSTRPIDLFMSDAWSARSNGVESAVGFLDFLIAPDSIDARSVLNLKSCSPIEADDLHRYLRGGGIVITAATTISVEDRPSVGLDCPEPRVFEGTKSSWLTRLTACETLLAQVGVASYIDLESEDAEYLLQEIDGLWHPAFSWHVDALRVALSGLDRNRYTDPHYPDRARAAAQHLEYSLARIGIATRSVRFR